MSERFSCAFAVHTRLNTKLLSFQRHGTYQISCNLFVRASLSSCLTFVDTHRSVVLSGQLPSPSKLHFGSPDRGRVKTCLVRVYSSVLRKTLSARNFYLIYDTDSYLLSRHVRGVAPIYGKRGTYILRNFECTGGMVHREYRNEDTISYHKKTYACPRCKIRVFARSSYGSGGNDRDCRVPLR